jgi:hypothetical protein
MQQMALGLSDISQQLSHVGTEAECEKHSRQAQANRREQARDFEVIRDWQQSGTLEWDRKLPHMFELYLEVGDGMKG